MSKLLIAAMLLLANVGQARDSECHQLKKKMDEAVTFNRVLQEVWGTIKLALFKKHYGTPVKTSIHPEALLEGGPRKNPAQNHMIFLLGVDPEDQGQIDDFQYIMETYTQLDDEMGRKKDELKQLFKALMWSESSCERKRKKLGFSFIHLLDLHRKLESYPLGKQFAEGMEAMKTVAEVFPDLRMKWNFRRGAGLEDIFATISREGIIDAVIVTHGAEGGKIFDADLSDFPVKFFNAISPTLRSLSLFVCHSQEAAELYDVEEALRSTKSYYDKRYLFTVRNNSFGRFQNVAPMMIFPRFMYKVDRKLAGKKIDYEGGHTPKNISPCQIKVSGLEVTGGKTVLTVNGNVVGVWTPYKSPEIVDFKCSYLKNDRNDILFETHGRALDAKIEKKFDAWIQMEDETSWKPLKREFDAPLRPDGSPALKFSSFSFTPIQKPVVLHRSRV